MTIEIEKKYELSQNDYALIKDKCKFIKQEEIKDYYLDTSDFKLLKDNNYLRMRNGLYEFKDTTYHSDTKLCTSQEIQDEEEIEKILQERYNISIDDTIWAIFIHTIREKYSYIFQWIDVYIDIDRYQYGERYEIEILIPDNNIIDGNAIIDSVRKEIGLTAGDTNSGKIVNVAMHQNIWFYEVLLNQF